MEKYGWTLTEVKAQPYFRLLEILSNDAETSAKSKPEEKVITGDELAKYFT